MPDPALFEDFLPPEENGGPEGDGDNPELSVEEIFSFCVKPVCLQIASFYIHVLVVCLIFRLSTQIISVPAWFAHLSSVICGTLCLPVLGSYVLYLVALIFLSVLSLFLAVKFKGKASPTVAVVCITYVLTCELMIVRADAWHMIRGALMIQMMKIVSLAFDIDSKSIPCPSFLASLGYCFLPGTTNYGPWISFVEYEKVVSSPDRRWSWTWFRQVLISSIFVFTFATVSSCWIHALLAVSTWRWWLAALDAASYRFSHYFISALGDLNQAVTGVKVANLLPNDHNSGENKPLVSTTNAVSGTFAVSNPWKVEWPRSLVEVVVHFNKPVHRWLKKYVFQTANARFGRFFAIFLTYAASALLHGLNGQLAAVLLSIGVYSYVEHQTRVKLARIYDACVLARPCLAKKCEHKNGPYSRTAIFVNGIFRFLTVFHLIYLGVMFDNSSSQESGFSIGHTLSKWMQLDFLSHWVVFVTFIFYKCI